jgi:hypothetical protein
MPQPPNGKLSFENKMIYPQSSQNRNDTSDCCVYLAFCEGILRAVVKVCLRFFSQPHLSNTPGTRAHAPSSLSLFTTPDAVVTWSELSDARLVLADITAADRSSRPSRTRPSKGEETDRLPASNLLLCLFLSFHTLRLPSFHASVNTSCCLALLSPLCSKTSPRTLPLPTQTESWNLGKQYPPMSIPLEGKLQLYLTHSVACLS